MVSEVGLYRTAYSGKAVKALKHLWYRLCFFMRASMQASLANDFNVGLSSGQIFCVELVTMLSSPRDFLPLFLLWALLLRLMAALLLGLGGLGLGGLVSLVLLYTVATDHQVFLDSG